MAERGQGARILDGIAACIETASDEEILDDACRAARSGPRCGAGAGGSEPGRPSVRREAAGRGWEGGARRGGGIWDDIGLAAREPVAAQGGAGEGLPVGRAGRHSAALGA